MSCRRGVSHLIYLFVAAFLISCGTSSQAPNEQSVREVLSLDSNWKFLFGEVSPNVLSADYDDSSWENVSIPHNWNRVGYYENNLIDHINTAENVDERQGTGWYRLVFKTPENITDKKIWLEFDAVSRIAEVWLNGNLVGEHRGGFNRFRFDITGDVLTDKENLLVVKADNSKPSPDSSTADVLPIDGDFFVHGGIYRPVRLVVSNKTHFDMMDLGGPGVYANTTKIENNLAEISIRSLLENSTNVKKNVELITQLIDVSGTVVAQQKDAVSIDAGTKTTHTQLLSVSNPELWQGRDNPYLYTLRSNIISEQNVIEDQLDQQFGIRLFTIDPEAGFLLNGKSYRLHGAAYHQDREGKGWAVTREDIEEDVSIMLDMGANTLRLAHYPHGQPVHEIANEQGIVLWDEIPLVSSWSYGPEHEDSNRKLAENAKLQLREMIRQNYNHPSVIVWGIANEVDFAAMLPARFAGRKGHEPLLEPLLVELDKISGEEDSSRPSSIANCCELRDELNNPQFLMTGELADTAGANRYFGWYYGKPSDLGPHLDYTRNEQPELALSVTEYGAGGAVSQPTDNPLGGAIEFAGVTQPEQYMSWFHEENWKQMANRSYLWATWIWNGFDFATVTRKEGDSIDINTKGIVTYDRKIKKDPFYFYKANWSSEPSVHIVDRRYVNRAYPVADVKVYSNTATTELFLNTRSLGEKAGCEFKVCVWENVRLDEGENNLVAKGTLNAIVEEDAIQWVLNEEQSDSYFIDSGSVLAAPSGRAKFGSDHFFDGGDAKSADVPGMWGRKPSKAAIKGTEDRALLTTYREGNFAYKLPVKTGKYRITLHFFEPSLSAGERVFSVKAGEETLLEDFDIAKNVGINTALSRSFEIEATKEELALAFEAKKGKAVVSAIEVEPAQ